MPWRSFSGGLTNCETRPVFFFVKVGKDVGAASRWAVADSEVRKLGRRTRAEVCWGGCHLLKYECKPATWLNGKSGRWWWGGLLAMGRCARGQAEPLPQDLQVGELATVGGALGARAGSGRLPHTCIWGGSLPQRSAAAQSICGAPRPLGYEVGPCLQCPRLVHPRPAAISPVFVE